MTLNCISVCKGQPVLLPASLRYHWLPTHFPLRDRRMDNLHANSMAVILFSVSLGWAQPAAWAVSRLHNRFHREGVCFPTHAILMQAHGKVAHEIRSQWNCTFALTQAVMGPLPAFIKHSNVLWCFNKHRLTLSQSALCSSGTISEKQVEQIVVFTLSP